jgi:hypothetical protein
MSVLLEHLGAKIEKSRIGGFSTNMHPDYSGAKGLKILSDY